MHNTRLLILLVGLTLVGAGCGQTANNNATNNTVNQATVTNQATTIAIADMAFSPATLRIKVGTTVTWRNDDGFTHLVQSDTTNLFQSPRLASGETYRFTFDTPGTFGYHCTIHPSMAGTITVE